MAVKLNTKARLSVEALLALTCVLCVSTIADAQSFDCKKAKTYAEKAICASPELSSLDIEMNTLYKSAQAKASDPDAFKTIARGNFALRSQCKDEGCLQKWFDNSISLYQYLLSLFPADSLADYPKEVQEACKNMDTTVSMIDCENAQTNYEQTVLNSHILEIMQAAKNDKQKKEVQDFYDQWKKDRSKYCSLEFSGGTIDSLNIAGCFLSWTKDLGRQTEDADAFLEGLTSSNITNESVAQGSM